MVKHLRRAVQAAITHEERIKSLLTGKNKSYIILRISCEAEITSAYDPKESGEQVEAPREHECSNGPPSVRGKAVGRIPQRVVTVISRGMCWHFQ